MNNYELADIAEKFFGTPYVWGGNDIETGMDCSAFVSECLRSIGKLPKADHNAQMLYDRFEFGSNSSEFYNEAFTYISDIIRRNDILLFGKDADNIEHVAIAVSPTMMIEAGGEGRKATTAGYVRYRPINNRSDLVAVARV